tara:strand:- start:83 stop:457 length:375 start_codon:yes stop_codon:yes gene_type:complete
MMGAMGIRRAAQVKLMNASAFTFLPLRSWFSFHGFHSFPCEFEIIIGQGFSDHITHLSGILLQFANNFGMLRGDDPCRGIRMDSRIGIKLRLYRLEIYILLELKNPHFLLRSSITSRATPGEVV